MTCYRENSKSMKERHVTEQHHPHMRTNTHHAHSPPYPTRSLRFQTSPILPDAFPIPLTNKATTGKATKIPSFLPLLSLRDRPENGCCQCSPTVTFIFSLLSPTCWIMGWPGGLYGPMPIPGQRQTHEYVVKATYVQSLFPAITAFCTFLRITSVRLLTMPSELTLFSAFQVIIQHSRFFRLFLFIFLFRSVSPSLLALIITS